LSGLVSALLFFILPGWRRDPLQATAGECMEELMKKKMLYLFVLVGAIFVGGGLRAEAQLSDRVDANIPFSFHAGGVEFPAGKYSIVTVDSDDGGSAMELSNADGTRHTFLETERGVTDDTQTSDELVFDHVGDDYFLSEIVDADEGFSAEIFHSGTSGTHEKAEGVTEQKHTLAFLHIP
jgi:hypothetical protein